MKRLLVVPRKTSHTPDDAWIGEPDLFTPYYDLVEISVVFTQDVAEAGRLERAWSDYASEVKVGGPAFDDKGGEFEPGRYVKKGIVHTSRGCPNNCPWCYVTKREGARPRPLKIKRGNIIQDSNLLACPDRHVRSVFEMLRGERAVEFKGGLDSRFLDDWHIENIKTMKVHEIWLAYDWIENKDHALRAIEKFRTAGFTRRKVRCYVMVGYEESRLAAERRLRDTWAAGALPFAQVYDGLCDPDIDSWRTFARLWQRPAIIKARMK
jgi:hypothetical protein